MREQNQQVKTKAETVSLLTAHWLYFHIYYIYYILGSMEIWFLVYFLGSYSSDLGSVCSDNLSLFSIVLRDWRLISAVLVKQREIWCSSLSKQIPPFFSSVSRTSLPKGNSLLWMSRAEQTCLTPLPAIFQGKKKSNFLFQFNFYFFSLVNKYLTQEHNWVSLKI